MNKQKTKFGGNGKISIDDELKIATKVLKSPKNKNSRIRFIEEMKILKCIKDKNIDNVVKIIYIDEQNSKIDMKLYDDDITKVPHCQPMKGSVMPVLPCLNLIFSKQPVKELKAERIIYPLG